MSQSLSRLRVAAKEALTVTALGRRRVLPRYRYSFNPSQLWALCDAAAGAAAGGGAIVEVGVAAGETTIFLNRHLQSLGLRPTYVCIDTFAGFTDDDIAVETSRGKHDDYSKWFRNQSERLFRRTLEANGLDNVEVFASDAVTFDYAALPELSFALIDVDLLRPMRAALDGCWERLQPGGILVADDCLEQVHLWDGAGAAYQQFCLDHGLAPDVRHEKLGFAVRPPR